MNAEADVLRPLSIPTALDPLRPFGAGRCMAHFESIDMGKRQEKALGRLSARLMCLPLKPISGLLCRNPILH